MTAPFTAAIVGCGRIAGRCDEPSPTGPVRTHAQAYHRHGAFRLDAVCDPDAEALAEFATRWRVARTYDSFDRFLEQEQPAVVSLCSRTGAHYGQLTRLLDYGGARVIFVEKPLCERRGELADVLARAAASKAAIVVNHTRRFDPGHLRIAREIADGRFGRLVGGRCEYYGGWLNNGTHAVDTLRMWLGDLAVATARRSPIPETRPGDPCLDVRLQTTSGAVVEVGACDERYYQVFELDLRFEAGRVLSTDFGRQLRLDVVETNAWCERELAPLDGPLAALTDPCLHPIARIADVLGGRIGSAATGATLVDAAATMGIVWDAMEAA